jgi:hypothetical protein
MRNIISETPIGHVSRISSFGARRRSSPVEKMSHARPNSAARTTHRRAADESSRLSAPRRWLICPSGLGQFGGEYRGLLRRRRRRAPVRSSTLSGQDESCPAIGAERHVVPSGETAEPTADLNGPVRRQDRDCVRVALQDGRVGVRSALHGRLLVSAATRMSHESALADSESVSQ